MGARCDPAGHEGRRHTQRILGGPPAFRPSSRPRSPEPLLGCAGSPRCALRSFTDSLVSAKTAAHPSRAGVFTRAKGEPTQPRARGPGRGRTRAGREPDASQGRTRAALAGSEPHWRPGVSPVLAEVSSAPHRIQAPSSMASMRDSSRVSSRGSSNCGGGRARSISGCLVGRSSAARNRSMTSGCVISAMIFIGP